jgi:hypothetical protein
MVRMVPEWPPFICSAIRQRHIGMNSSERKHARVFGDAPKSIVGGTQGSRFEVQQESQITEPDGEILMTLGIALNH